MRMGTALVVVGLLAGSRLAKADASVAGYWIATLGGGVTIEMNVAADDQWNSEMRQGAAPIAEMAGTYRQLPRSPVHGTLVFVPSQTHIVAQHGAPKIEYDNYRLSADGQTLQLTSVGDTMEFHKLFP